MFYSLLGRVVWMAAKWYLRRRYGRVFLSKPVLAGGVLAISVAAVLATKRHHSGDE
jgi:hypothetical protein